MLNERIRQTNFTLDVLKGNHQNIEQKLRAELTEVDFWKVSEFTESKQRVEHEAVKIRKFERLKNERNKTVNSAKSGTTLSKNNVKDKWVINLSSRDLKAGEVSVLEKGLYFVVSPDTLPVKDSIIATESVCKELPGNKAAELRPRVVHIVKTSKTPATNVIRGERSAIKELRKDDSILILPADEGKATVVIDATSCEEKALSLLQDDSVYAKLKKDPTQKFQSKPISLLKELKESGAIDAKTYWKIYPTVSDVPIISWTCEISQNWSPTENNYFEHRISDL